MEFLILVFIIIVLILVVGIRSDVRDRFLMLNSQLELLKEELRKVREKAITPVHTVEKPIVTQETIIQHKAPVVQTVASG